MLIIILLSLVLPNSKSPTTWFDWFKKEVAEFEEALQESLFDMTAETSRNVVLEMLDIVGFLYLYPTDVPNTEEYLTDQQREVITQYCKQYIRVNKGIISIFVNEEVRIIITLHLYSQWKTKKLNKGYSNVPTRNYDVFVNFIHKLCQE